MDQRILQVGDELFTINDFHTTWDIRISTDDDKVHMALMKVAALRLGIVKDDVYTYLIAGKIIQVNGVKPRLEAESRPPLSMVRGVLRFSEGSWDVDSTDVNSLLSRFKGKKVRLTVVEE